MDELTGPPEGSGTIRALLTQAKALDDAWQYMVLLHFTLRIVIRDRMKSTVITAFVVVACAMTLRAGSYTWNNAGNSWFSDANWDGDAGYPGNGDTAIINSGTILLTNNTAYLSSLTMNGGTLVMSNWSTTLSATNIDINIGSTVTLPNAFKNTPMSNRLHFVCGSFTLATGATINVQGRGYAGGNGTSSTDDGYGPGAGQVVGGYYGGGGGNGGAGDDGCQGIGGITNGSVNTPLNPGSGGAGNAQHFADVFGRGKADAALAASIFHFGVTDSWALKRELAEHGIPVRL